MAFLPGHTAVSLDKFRWLVRKMDPSSKEKKIHFSQANSYFHLSFMTSGFPETLYAECVNIEFPRFYFNVYEQSKGGIAIAHFKMDGEIKENKGKMLVVFPAPATVWRDGDA